MDKVILALQQVIQSEVDAQVLANAGPLKEIKKVYYGDPIKIPESDFPCITIMPTNSDYILRGSRYDQKDHTIEIRLIVNQKRFYDSSNPDPVTVRVVKDVVEKVETNNNVMMTDHESIAGLIQANVCLYYDPPGATPEYLVSSLTRVTNISYIFSDQRGFPTYEVIITVLANVVGDR